MPSKTESPSPGQLLFMQISDKSYDEIFLIERLTQQWIEQYGECEVTVCVNGNAYPFVSSHPKRLVTIFTEDQEKNRQKFEILRENVKFDAIILLDVYEYFVHPMDLNFLPAWLKDVENPLYAVDYFNLLVYQKDHFVLRHQVDIAEENRNSVPLDLPLELLKPVLPNMMEQISQETKTWPVQSVFSELTLKAAHLRTEIFESMEAKDSDFLITVAFDPFLFTQAAERQLSGYYLVLIEVLVFYLRQFKGQHFHVFIVGMKPPAVAINLDPEINVNLHYFGHFTEDNYAAFLGASDLLVLNNTWSVALLDALYLNLPVCIFGNSIIEAWKDDTETQKELRASFQPLKPLYDLCHLMINMNQYAMSTPIFQFVTYPLRDERLHFPQAGLQEAVLPYFLIDMFDDMSTLPLLKELLLSQTTRQGYATLCQNYLQKQQGPLRFGQIHKQVTTNHE